MSRNRLIDNIIQRYGKPKETWPDVDFPDFKDIKDEKIKERIVKFKQRKAALDQYFDGVAIEKINYYNEKGEPQKITRSELHRWIKRCVSSTDDGHIYGYAGLIPYYHIDNYIRTKDFNFEKMKTGLSGVFTEFLKQHPDIEKMIIEEYLYGGQSDVKTKGTRGIDIYRKMIRMCKIQNLYQEYPLNRMGTTKHPGKRALYDYLKKIKNSNYNAYAKMHLTESGELLARTTGNGQKNNPLPVDVLETIEVDEHFIDGKFIITKTSYEGDKLVEEVDNITLIYGIEANSRAILGYHVVPGKSYTSQDIQRCIINCIVPHKNMTFSIPGFKYPSEICFPSQISKEMEWARFNEIKFDNHMTHKSAEIRRYLEEDLKVHINYGAVRHATTRSYIEKSFDIFERNTFHRLPNTTGGKIDSPIRNNPEKQALKYQITFFQAKQIIELGIAEYNLTCKQGVYNMSPIQAIRSRLSSGRIPSILEESMRDEVTTIKIKVSVNVLGNLEKGRNPYVNYQYARYTSSKLAEAKELIGTKLTLSINIDDARFADAYDEKGAFVDTLVANSKWGSIPHTLKFRNFLCTLRASGEVDFTDSEDFIDVFKAYASRCDTAKVGNDFICEIEQEMLAPKTNNTISEDNRIENKVSINSLLPDGSLSKNKNINKEEVDKLRDSGFFEILSNKLQHKL